MTEIDITEWVLEPIREIGIRGSRGRSHWLYRCRCGNEVEAMPYVVRTGRKRSCGCLKKSHLGLRSMTHGHAVNYMKSSELLAYQSAKARCYMKGNERYSKYGGRGIKMCERWKNDPSAFIADMGPKPSRYHSLDRINVDGDYSPENCRWADLKTQMHNRTNTVMVVYKGNLVPIVSIDRHPSVSESQMRKRVGIYGWDAERAAMTPCHPTRGRKV